MVDEGLLYRAERLRELLGRPEFAAALSATTEVYENAIRVLRAGDLSAAEDLFPYLETRPRFHQSGYLAEKIIRALNSVDLSARQRERFHRALDAIVAERPRSREHGEALKALGATPPRVVSSATETSEAEPTTGGETAGN